MKITGIGHGITKEMKAEIILLHLVAEVTGYASLKISPIIGLDNYCGFDSVYTNPTSDFRRIDEVFWECSKQILDDETIQTLALYEDYNKTIVEIGREMNADMIVLVHLSKKDLKMLVGCGAEVSVRYSSIFLLIIPIIGA